MTSPDGRDLRWAMFAAEAETDLHDGTCVDCLAGRVCGQADDLYDAEYRAWKAWDQVDPKSAASRFKPT